MPRYFFHITDGQEFHDEEGTELRDLASAETEASWVLATHLRDHPREPWDEGEVVLSVADDSGLTLLTLTLISQHSAASPVRAAPQLRG